MHRRKLKEIAETLVARDLWRLLNRMLEEEDHDLTDKLTVLMERVRDELADNGPFARRDWEMGELAFARMATVSQA